MTSLLILKCHDEPTWSIRHTLLLYWAKTCPESPHEESYSTFCKNMTNAGI